MNPVATQYRDHKIVVRDEIAFASSGVTGMFDKQSAAKRVIVVDDVDVTSRCRMSNTDEENTEAAKRFIDRIYPKGKDTQQ